MTIKIVWLLILQFALPAAALCAPQTMRLDYYHTGDADTEVFSVDRVVIEPLPWPGNPRRPIDDTNLGVYLFEIIDQDIGDGYTAAERGKFASDARRLLEKFFATSPFRERRQDFNVWGLCPPAQESGISRPSTGVHRHSPLGTTYDVFGSERYVLSLDNRAFRSIAAFAPYDFVEILVNSETYGGGGIFGLYSTVAADSAWAPYIFIHEFGHHFAALADEYFTSAVAYASKEDRLEPWEPNVTALLDPALLKWRHLLTADTPLPTPWNLDAYSRYSLAIQERRKTLRAEGRPEAQMDALFREEQAHVTAMLQAEKHHGRVGAYEGAMYAAKGYFRPELDCIMFSRDEVPFCAVCREAIERVIEFYVR